MPASVPITQDLVTLPRQQLAAARPNLVGLPRAELTAALIAAGTPEAQAAMRTRQIWQWIYHKGARDFAAMAASTLTPRSASAFIITTDQLPLSGSHSRVWRPGPWADATQKSSPVGSPEGAPPAS